MTSGSLVSIVIPIYNEQEGLAALFLALYPVLDGLGRPYEILFVDDGSRDRSASILREQYSARPDVTRLILLASNFGQHNAILAAFEHSRGEAVITLDGDLQNPPAEIPRLLAELDKGHDYVGTIRGGRRDSAWRVIPSKLLNAIRERTTHIRITDQGCMLRAYSRDVIDAINACEEVNTYIPALGYLFARSPVEIEVAHSERVAGESKYTLYSLLRLNFDLMTGFSIVPLQLYSLLGAVISAGSLVFVAYLGVRRMLVGPEAEGVFTLFGIVFFLIGVLLAGMGLMGEYIGRIYAQVRRRPRYRIRVMLGDGPGAAPDDRGGESP